MMPGTAGENLANADLHQANFRGADLQHGDFTGADIFEADLRETNLQGADLRESKAVCSLNSLSPPAFRRSKLRLYDLVRRRAYFSASMVSRCSVCCLASRVPVTFTLAPANFSGLS